MEVRVLFGACDRKPRKCGAFLFPGPSMAALPHGSRGSCPTTVSHQPPFRRTHGPAHQQGESIDVLTVERELESSGKLDAAGGFDAISALTSAVPSRMNSAEDLSCLLQWAAKRGLTLDQ